MKTAAAILLMGILLFNWAGYRVLNDFMQDRTNVLLESQLDRRNFDESQLISIKLPATHLAYYNNSVAFERVDGQLEINGVPYKYVKRRIYNDSIELLCIPNQMALILRISGDEYFRLINDIQRSQQEKGHSATKSFAVDPYTITDPLGLGDRSLMLIIHVGYFPSRLLSRPEPATERPPAFTA